MRKKNLAVSIVVALLLLVLNTGKSPLQAQDIKEINYYTCDKHQELTENEVVIITIWEEDFHLCQKCVFSFIENNSEEVGRMMKHMKGGR